MTNYGSGVAWAWDGTSKATITPSDWTTYNALPQWTASGYNLDNANRQIVLTSAEAARAQQMWADYGSQVILKRLTPSNFTTAPHYGQMLAALMGATSNGWKGFREQLPGFIDDRQTPQFIRCGLYGTNLAQARLQTGKPFITADQLQDDVNLATDAAIAVIASQAASHSYDPMQMLVYHSRGFAKTVGSTQSVWQVDTRQQPSGTSWDNEMTRMMAFFAAQAGNYRYRS